jgi:HSP20 family molecular chaperone IbpA
MRPSLPVTAMILATAATTIAPTAEARSYGRLLTASPSRRYQYSRRPHVTIDSILSDVMMAPFFKFQQDANSLLRQHASALLSSATHTTTPAGSQLRLDDVFSLETPAYTIFENAKTGAIELSMDIPGVAAKDLSIELENDVIRISGSRKHKKSLNNDEETTTTESKFDQSFQLDSDINAEGLEVTLSDGVLRVSAPKKEKVVKRLAVKTNDSEEDSAALEASKASDQGTVEWSMDVPGVAVEDLSIELENDSILRIAGSRKRMNHIGETVESKFHQNLQLNNDVEPDGLEVTLSHGVLRVSAPKKEKIVKRLAIKPAAEEDYVALDTTAIVDQEIAVAKTPVDETPVEEVMELDDEAATSY